MHLTQFAPAHAHPRILLQRLRVLAHVISVGTITWLGPLASPSAHASEGAPHTEAQPNSEGTKDEEDGRGEEASAKPEEPDEHHFTLQVRGFGGTQFEAGEVVGGGGGNILFSVPFAKERFEAELSLGVLAGAHQVLGIADVTFKRVFEIHEHWSPHIALGPVFALDFHNGISPSGGLLVGGGVIYWLRARVGLSSELAFRMLFGEGTREVLSLAFGVAVLL